jgi:lysophospholipase L1-like esterase
MVERSKLRALAFLGGLVLCGVFEVAVRGYAWLSGRGFASPIVEDRILGFALRPNFEGWHWSRHRPQLVVHLGDSTTFGVSVEAEETYAARLSEKLEQCRPGRYDSMTAAVPGYSSREGVRLVHERDLFERFPPSVVTVHYGWNDHWYHREERGSAPLRGPRRWKAWLLERSFLLQGLQVARGSFGQWLEGRRIGPKRRAELEEFLAGLRAGTPPEPTVERLNVTPHDFVANLTILVQESRRVGAEVVLLVPVFAGPESLRALLEEHPLLSTEPFFFHAQYQDLIRRVAVENNVPWIDLPVEFAARSGSLYAGSDPIHPNAAGHGVIADRLARLLCGR